MRRVVALVVSQPCNESWAAMTPTATGRHCAACAQTVVDFTHHTDAEILAYLARAASGRTCGRFAAGQLERPLQRAAPAAPTARWRAWLAAAVAAWGLRESAGMAATAAQGPARQQAHQPTRRRPRKAYLPAAPAALVHGVVRDAATGEALPGVAVFLAGENQATATSATGHFSLRVPAGRRHTAHRLILHLFGYHSRTVAVPAEAKAAGALRVELQTDDTAAGAEIVAQHPAAPSGYISGLPVIVAEEHAVFPKTLKPLPQPSRSFTRWFARFFRRG